MARRKRCRIIKGPPKYNSFKPKGVPSNQIKQIKISLDEYESIRLADNEGYDHNFAAEKIGVSRSVFSRLVKSARAKIAKALVDGYEILIEGGEYHFEKVIYRCNDCYAIMEVDVGTVSPRNCTNCGSNDLYEINKRYGHRGRCRRHGMK